MEIILAKNSGFCFGVKEAIKKTLEQIELNSDKKIYTLGPLIHNEIVTNELEEKGIEILTDLEKVEPHSIVVIRSHGEGKSVYDFLKSRNVTIIDATCPFVSKIHDLVYKANMEGKKVVIVGDSTHPEVIGINGWCDNSAIIVNSKSDIDKITEDNLFIVSQTTLIKETLDEVVNAIKEKGKSFEVKNTICNATKLRQESCEEVAKKCDMMVVIGGTNSSNSKKLYDIAKKNCKNSFFVEKNEDFLLQESRKYNTIGISAGASTPERIIKEVIATMSKEKIMSMEELLKEENYDLDKAMKLPRLGEIVNGVVHQVTEKQVVVDMGCKKDGVIPQEEVTMEGEQKLTDLFKVGDEIQAKVIKIDEGEGYLTLSKKKLEVFAHWDEIKKAYESQEILTVKVERVVNGGVIARYKEVQGLIPLPLLSDRFVKNPEEFIGQELEVIVNRIEERRNRVSFSHRDVLTQEKAEKLAEVWGKINVGDIVEGKVMRFSNYGAFVDLGGIDGLLHISEISYGKIKHPSEVLKIGDIVQVKVLAMNQEKQRISLGLKQTKAEPWSTINEKFEVGQVVTGKVVSIQEYGAFVELEPGLDGLVHISEISHERVEKVSDALKVGQEVSAKILEIDEEKKRISLSIKATIPAPIKEEVKEEEAEN